MTELIAYEWSPNGEKFYYEVFPEGTRRDCPITDKFAQKVTYSEKKLHSFESER